MLTRTLFRTFKSWAQYQAERLGTTESNLLSIREAITQGPYTTWKHRQEVTKKIHFLLDHCTPEEQKLYLKEFTTEELTQFLLGELYTMSLEDATRIGEVKVQNHALPGFNLLFTLFNPTGVRSDVKGPDDEKSDKIRNDAKRHLRAKVKELQWRKLDQQISGSA